MKHRLLLMILISLSTKIHANQLSRITKNHNFHTDRSAVFIKIQDQTILYEENKNLSLIPASTTKLLLAITALDLFGPYQTFNTDFYYTGKRIGSTIEGDLIILGSGDPLIINEKLWQMAADFKHMGIKKFLGNIVIDNSLFDDEKRDKSRRSQTFASSNAYDAPVSAFGVNFNTFPIAISPAHDKNKSANISLDPYPINGIELNNQTITNDSYNAKIKATRISARDKDRVVVSGVIGKKVPLKKLYRSVRNPAIISGETIRSFLKAEDIEVSGKVITGKIPKDANKIYSIEGFTIARMIEGLNKFSNNYIADVLTKKLGTSFPHMNRNISQFPSGSFGAGTSVISEYMKKNIEITGEFAIENGSGLDSRNRLSAYQLTKSLLFAERHIKFFPDFMASMPLAGFDGTLKRRFSDKKTSTLKGQVRGKTGTLTSPVTVSSISGYIQHEKQGLIAYAIIENGQRNRPQPDVYTLQKSHDELIYSVWSTLSKPKDR